MENISKDNALQTAGTVAFVTLVVAGTHFLMDTIKGGIGTLSNKINEARNAKEDK